jgi:hypothetical protein
VQAPYTATRTIFGPYLYQVNDPLVHYMANDLDAGAGAVWQNTSIPNGVWSQSDDPTTMPIPTPPTTDIIKGRYQPWGKTAPTAFQTSSYNFLNPYNLIYKDPLVWSADYWDFPANRYPTVGWLGRVHRGTPWQTVFLKAHNVLHVLGASGDVSSGTNTWTAWTGDNIYDAANSAPLQDRLLFDLFTTAFNDNATRGTLSVNQTNLAAWSALFSGMIVLTNTTVSPNEFAPPTFGWTNINPAGVAGLASPLGQLVAGINTMRATFTNADGLAGVFEHVGDILSTPRFTERSLFLNCNNSAQQQAGISDEMYEWLPQQTMSLLRCPTSPRYVIYCYGQTLKPAPDSIVSSGSYFGMVTNYQVVSEIATRAVVRFNSALTNVVAGTNTLGGPWFSVPVVTNNNAVIENFNILPPD